jgi:hypothetical protein
MDNIKHLLAQSNKLRPYKMFVATFSQVLIDSDPVFSELLYNDFAVTPTFRGTIGDPGKYTLQIDNFNELGILPGNEISVSIEYILASSIGGHLLCSLTDSHDLINVVNMEATFGTWDAFIGKYVIFYYNYF